MRIDDDSAERAQADARTQERKLQEQQNKRRTDEATAFDKALQGRNQAGQAAKAATQGQKESAKSAIRSLVDARKDVSADGKMEGRLEHAEVESLADDAHHLEQTGDQQKLARGAAGRKEVDRKTGRMIESGRGDDNQVHTGQSERAQDSAHQGELKQAARKTDGKSDDSRQDGRDERQGPPTSGGKSTSNTQKVTERPDKQRDSGQQGNQGGGSQNPGAFRLPPAALMAPPPVAVPKGDGQVNKLRQLAQEIADKIVKQARVGTNKMGLPEFQLELKSDILKGLKVKVSGRHGRIRALFSSRDPGVLKQLRGEADSLRAALTARGLKVDALDIEEERS